MKIAVVIITFQTKRPKLIELKKQFKKLLHLENKDFIIVNNSKNNIGFGAGANFGLTRAFTKKYDLVVIANPDISLKSLSIGQIKKSITKFDIFGGAFKQNDQTYYGGIIDKKSFSGGLKQIRPRSIFYKTDFASGSLMFITKKAYLINGPFSEKYFLYYEDVEYCYRAKQNSLRVGINTLIKYVHLESSSHSYKKEYFLTRNRLLFLKQYGTRSQKLYQYLKIPYTMIFLLTNMTEKNSQKIRGYLDFFRT